MRLSIPLVEIDIGLLADKIAVSTSHTLYLGQGVHDLLLAVHIGTVEYRLARTQKCDSEQLTSTSGGSGIMLAGY